MIGARTAVLAALVALGALEVAVRVAHLADTPLYVANNIVGYIPKPSQAGNFLRTNDWQFNALSMGTAKEFTPTPALDILLIGDSVVNGGNPSRQVERLGPRLQEVAGLDVWPVSAGSWALRNELAYLASHPEVSSSIDRFIFVLNFDDFEEASSWRCRNHHPLERPLLAAMFVFRKYVYDWSSCIETPPDLRVPPGDWRAELRQFLDRVRGREVWFFLYPEKSDPEGSVVQRHREALVEAGAQFVFSIADDPRWRGNGLYRDNIHPSVQGARVLAEIIASPRKDP